MVTVPIDLPHDRYDITIEPGVLDRLGTIVRGMASHARCMVIVDEHVMELHGHEAIETLRHAGYDPLVHEMSSGEAYKTLETVRRAYDAMLEARLERGSPVVAVGGGVTGDTAGFIAATYLRGVPFFQCPTTLLAMVDASVGGKVGVNVPQGKNLIGAFYQPRAVIMDPLVLQTLPQRELLCGLAECIKHGVIRDADLFDWIEQNTAAILKHKPDEMVELLARNVRIKAAVVIEDEKEAGIRAHLNFGHTFAHAIEATSGYGHILHGEAVALGMLAAAHLAADLGRCDRSVHDRLLALLEKVGLPTKSELVSTEELMNAMLLDKKVRDAKLRLVLPERIGAVNIIDDAPAERIAAAWETIGTS